MFLELGVLPIEYEIHQKQISFVHHIMNLDEDDPVKKVWRNQTILPPHRNWWSDVRGLMERYSIQLTEEEIVDMSKETFKKKIKKAIRVYAFEKLKAECQSKSRTKNLTYKEFETQNYIKTMSPRTAKTVFKCRSKTLNIKDHMKFSHNDTLCRWCGMSDETLDHVINCGEETKLVDTEENLNLLNHKEIEKIAWRVDEFLSKVDIQ